MDGGAWWTAVHGVTKSRTRLSDFPFTFHFQALEKEMATHSRVLAWRIPGTGEPGELSSMGVHRVGHDWSNLAAAASLWSPKAQVNFFSDQPWPRTIQWREFLEIPPYLSDLGQNHCSTHQFVWAGLITRVFTMNKYLLYFNWTNKSNLIIEGKKKHSLENTKMT